MRLTGGSIEYSERRKIADYEHKDCKFMMSFALEDDEKDVPAVLDAIQAEIRDRVRAMLGLSKPVEHVKPAKALEEIPAEEPKPEPKKRGPKPKPPVVAAIDDAPDADPVEATPEPDMDLGLDEPTITDTQLATAVQERAKAIGNAKPVRELITKFTGVVGGKVYAVTQDNRAEFLTALAAVK